MSERLVTHGGTNPTPTGQPAMGLDANGGTYALPLAVAGSAVLTQQSASPKTIKTAVGAISANTKLTAITGANVVKVQVLQLRTAYSAALLNPILTDGNGGATLWDDRMQAISNTLFGSNLPVSAPTYIFKTSAGNDLWLNPAGQTVYYAISYWDSDAS